MFGYIKPYTNELKGKHVNEYKMNYCTLCHGLRLNLGFWSTLLLNYECTFLYIFLVALYPEIDVETKEFRCPANPIKKQYAQVNSNVLEYVSFVNYHLALLKVYDGVTDSKFVKGLIYRVVFRIMNNNKKYILLRDKYSEMAKTTDELCKDLYRLEIEVCKDFDMCSATMGNVLYEIINFYLQRHPIKKSEAVLEFSKHLGMWTYLIDAYDDYEYDCKHGKFNPLNSFVSENGMEDNSSIGLQSGEMMLGMMTVNLSELHKNIDFYRYEEIIGNIVNHGTRNAVQTIKNKREKKKNDCGCKKDR